MPVPHPVKAVLASRRITVRSLSAVVGVNERTLSRVLNGYVEPWPALRRKTSAFLELPEADLFRLTGVAS